MALSVSGRSLQRANERLASLKQRIANVRKRAEQSVEKIVRTGEVAGSAFIVGVVQGKTGGVEIVGVPFELLGGIGLNVLGYFGAAGRMSGHLNNVGDGMLAAYAVTIGRGVGKKWEADKGKDKKGIKSSGVGALGPGQNRLTPEEMAAVAAAQNAAA